MIIFPDNNLFPFHTKNDTCIGTSPSVFSRPTQGTINSTKASTTVACKCFNILSADKMAYFVVHIVVGLATGSTAVVLALLCSATFCFIVVCVYCRKKRNLDLVRYNYYTNPNVELQTFQDHKSLPKLTINTLPPSYDQYSEVSVPYSVTAFHTHEKGNRTRPPLPNPPQVHQNQPCTYENCQNDSSLSDTYVLPDDTEDIYEHMDSAKMTDACQLKSEMYKNAI